MVSSNFKKICKRVFKDCTFNIALIPLAIEAIDKSFPARTFAKFSPATGEAHYYKPLGDGNFEHRVTLNTFTFSTELKGIKNDLTRI